jgi:hypothetical protein
MRHYKIQSTSLRGTPKQPHHHNRFASGYLAMTLALVFFACAQKQEEQKPSLLGDFWKKEIARLNKEQPMITKISTVNGKSDTIRTDSIDWEKELQIFVKNDLKETDLGYEMKMLDSLNHINCGFKVYPGHITREFNSKDSTAEILKLTIDIAGIFRPELHKIKENDRKFYPMDTAIEVITSSKQQLYSMYKKLMYSTEKGYVIEGSQDVKFLNGINYKVQVKFKE